MAEQEKRREHAAPKTYKQLEEGSLGMKPPSCGSEQAEFYLLRVLEVTEPKREAKYSNLSTYLETKKFT